MAQKTKTAPPLSDAQAVIHAAWNTLLDQDRVTGSAPLESELAAYVATLPHDAVEEAHRRLTETVATEVEAFHVRAGKHRNFVDFLWERGTPEDDIPKNVAVLEMLKSAPAHWSSGPGGETMQAATGMGMLGLPDLDAIWHALGDERPPYFLTPILTAYSTDGGPVAPYRPKRKAGVPSLGHEPTEPMPDFGRTPPDPSLPGLGRTDAECPSWLLRVFAHHTLKQDPVPMVEGRAAGRALRLLVGAFSHFHVTSRTGRKGEIRFPMGYVIRWLHPEFEDLSDPRTMRNMMTGLDEDPAAWKRSWPNWRRDWERFPAALRAIDRTLGLAPVNDGRALARVAAMGYLPMHPDEEYVEFWLRVWPEAAGNVTLDWRLLSWYGLYHPIAYRAYLVAAHLMDNTARWGHPQRLEIGQPILGDDGQPKRRKDGGIQRSEILMIDNPRAQLVAPLTDADLAAVIGLDPRISNNRARAREAFERLDADNVLDLVSSSAGVRLYGPRRVEWLADRAKRHPVLAHRPKPTKKQRLPPAQARLPV